MTEPSKTITKSALPTISPAWEVMQLNKGDPLDIPRALDHRFFVNGAPKCFRDSLFEEGEEGEGAEATGDSAEDGGDGDKG